MRPNKYTKFVFVYFVLGDFMVPKTFAEKPSASKKLFTSYGGGFKENVTKQKKKGKLCLFLTQQFTLQDLPQNLLNTSFPYVQLFSI